MRSLARMLHTRIATLKADSEFIWRTRPISRRYLVESAWDGRTARLLSASLRAGPSNAALRASMAQGLAHQRLGNQTDFDRFIRDLQCSYERRQFSPLRFIKHG